MNSFAEMERLHNIFTIAAKPAAPAMPRAAVFSYFDTFRQCLEDLYGLNGNMHTLYRNKTYALSNCWSGKPTIHGDKILFQTYKVEGAQLAEFYEKMNDDDRKDFKTAYNAFLTTLPSLHACIGLTLREISLGQPLPVNSPRILSRAFAAFQSIQA